MKLFDVLATGKPFRHQSWPFNETAVYFQGNIILEHIIQPRWIISGNKTNDRLIGPGFELRNRVPDKMTLNSLVDNKWEIVG
jgi:hypothetical protein